MSIKTLLLSSAGLKNLIIDDREYFSFIIGEKEIKFHKILAEFLSPIVSNLHRMDPTINSIDYHDIFKQTSKVKMPQIDEMLTEDSINKLYDLSRGLPVEINEEDCFSMRFISIILGNEEMFEEINKLFYEYSSEIDIDRYIEQLRLFYYFSHQTQEFNYSSIINIISSHFYSFDPNKLLQLPKQILYEIISNKHLKLETEDSLYDFIQLIFQNEEEEEEKGNNDDDYYNIIHFYEELEFLSLSKETFADFLDHFNSNEMTGNLWRKLMKCFYINYDECIDSISRNRFIMKIEYDENEKHRFCGIVKYLRKKNENAVDVSANSIFDDDEDYKATNAIDFENDEEYFSSKNESNSWLKYDFNDKRVRPTSYSIAFAPNNRNQPLEWCIEGSNDDEKWKVLDTQNELSSTKEPNESVTYKILAPIAENEFYRFLRIRQTEINSSNNHIFKLSSLEYFGFIA